MPTSTTSLGGSHASTESQARVRDPHPALSGWFQPGEHLPDLELLEQQRLAAQCADGIARPRISAQDPALLADGFHYEARIAATGQLATRRDNAHDAFNARAWARHPRLKWAINARQIADIAKVGSRQRTRGQCALTHFDEAGAIVWLADPSLLPAWDGHDWPVLFRANAAAWGRELGITVFGHAVLEHLWSGFALPVTKCVVVAVDAGLLAAHSDRHANVLWPVAEAAVAAEIVAGRLLADPQELRPLPLAGIPGWHARGAQQDFFACTPCFQPVRAGRGYPAPWSLQLAES